MHGLSDYLRRFKHPGGIIVCEEKQFIYMKAPRTGGTSILRHVLEPSLNSIIHHKDHPAEFAKWMRQLTDEQLSRYYIFSFTRNPWDRLVSVAHHFNISFDTLIKDFDRLQAQLKIQLHSLPIHLYTHFSGVPFVDFIGRFEHLQDDFDQVCKRVGISQVKLPHASSTRHAHYSTYYDPDAEAIVASRYAKDIETFGYRFEKE